MKIEFCAMKWCTIVEFFFLHEIVHSSPKCIDMQNRGVWNGNFVRICSRSRWNLWSLLLYERFKCWKQECKNHWQRKEFPKYKSVVRVNRKKSIETMQAAYIRLSWAQTQYYELDWIQSNLIGSFAHSHTYAQWKPVELHRKHQTQRQFDTNTLASRRLNQM